MAPAFHDPRQSVHNLVFVHGFLLHKSWTANSRADLRQNCFGCCLHFTAEPVWGLNHEIKEQASATGGKLGLLRDQFFDCSRHAQFGLRAHMGTCVENPVNGSCAKPGLAGDLFDWKAMCHLMCF